MAHWLRDTKALVRLSAFRPLLVLQDKKELTGSSPSMDPSLAPHCLKCRGSEFKCIQTVYVSRKKNARKFLGSIITAADPGDRVPFQVSVLYFFSKLCKDQL
jgi:hypothetical protein